MYVMQSSEQTEYYWKYVRVFCYVRVCHLLAISISLTVSFVLSLPLLPTSSTDCWNYMGLNFIRVLWCFKTGKSWMSKWVLYYMSQRGNHCHTAEPRWHRNFFVFPKELEYELIYVLRLHLMFFVCRGLQMLARFTTVIKILIAEHFRNSKYRAYLRPSDYISW